MDKVIPKRILGGFMPITKESILRKMMRIWKQTWRLTWCRENCIECCVRPAMMYFSNCDERGDQHLGGTVQLIEHLYHGQCYRSTGYFADLKEESGTTKFYPYENQFHPVFEKKTRGLKIIIPYLRSEFDNEDEIIKTVCDSFFISILDGQLEVHINDHVINGNTIENYVKDSIITSKKFPI